jgi:ABC-type lipoprotein export system ATPase subunit
MLSVGAVSKAYQNRRVLNEVSFAMNSGERVALMGPSGSDKSTLLNCLSGLDTPDEGTIIFDGEELTRLSPDERTLLRRGRLGSIFQFFHLLPTLTALENVALSLQLNNYSASEQAQLAMDMLEEVDVAHRAKAFPREMSGGEMQRVAIARALVIKPKLLLADEPTGNLDTKNGERVLNLIEALSEAHQVGLILVTHQEETTRICHRTLHIHDGILSEDALESRA